MTRAQESSSPVSDFLDKNKHDKQILIVAMDLTLLRLGVCRVLCDEFQFAKPATIMAISSTPLFKDNSPHPSIHRSSIE